MSKATLHTAFILALLPAVAGAAGEAEYREVLDAARAQHARAAELDQHQWTVTRDRLKAAEAAAAKGDYEQALELAREARALAEASVAQARNQDEAWQRMVLR